MKPSSAIFIIVVLIISILMSVANTTFTNGTEGNTKLYTKPSVIVIESTQIANDLWEVTCEDEEGYVWSFFDDGTLMEGDVIMLIMQSVNDIPENDEIVEIILD